MNVSAFLTTNRQEVCFCRELVAEHRCSSSHGHLRQPLLHVSDNTKLQPILLILFVKTVMCSMFIIINMFNVFNFNSE